MKDLNKATELLLRAMKKPLVPYSADIPDAAYLIGVANKTMWKMVKEGKIPAKRFSRNKLLVKTSDLIDLYESLPDVDAKGGL